MLSTFWFKKAQEGEKGGERRNKIQNDVKNMDTY